MTEQNKYTTQQKVKIGLAVFLVLIFGIFMAQNWDPVNLQFLGWDFEVVLFLALLLSFVAGALLVWVLLTFKMNKLKKEIKKLQRK